MEMTPDPLIAQVKEALAGAPCKGRCYCLYCKELVYDNSKQWLSSLVALVEEQQEDIRRLNLVLGTYRKREGLQ